MIYQHQTQLNVYNHGRFWHFILYHPLWMHFSEMTNVAFRTRMHFTFDSVLTEIWSAHSHRLWKRETKASLFYVNNTVCEWTAQLMELLWHIIHFTLHTDWVHPFMRKYAVGALSLWGVWLTVYMDIKSEKRSKICIGEQSRYNIK